MTFGCSPCYSAVSSIRITMLQFMHPCCMPRPRHGLVSAKISSQVHPERVLSRNLNFGIAGGVNPWPTNMKEESASSFGYILQRAGRPLLYAACFYERNQKKFEMRNFCVFPKTSLVMGYF